MWRTNTKWRFFVGNFGSKIGDFEMYLVTLMHENGDVVRKATKSKQRNFCFKILEILMDISLK